VSGRTLDGPARVLRLVARKLAEYLDGDERALETLGESLAELDASPDDVEAAILGIRGLAGVPAPGGWIAGTPGRDAHRVLSAEERDVLTTEAWGYLLAQRTSGALAPGPFERVLETLVSGSERPVGVERAKEVAAQVVLEVEDDPVRWEPMHGDQEVAH